MNPLAPHGGPTGVDGLDRGKHVIDLVDGDGFWIVSQKSQKDRLPRSVTFSGVGQGAEEITADRADGETPQ